MTTPSRPALTLAAKPRELTPLDPATVRLSVLIPVYNERNTIETILSRVHTSPVQKEIICVDDCSTDGTRELLQQRGDIVLRLRPRNGGKGAAVQPHRSHHRTGYHITHLCAFRLHVDARVGNRYLLGLRA